MTIDKEHSDPAQSSDGRASGVGFVVDVDDLAQGLRESGDWEGIALLMAGLLHRIEAVAPVTLRAAVCEPNLALTLGWPLHRMEFSIHVAAGPRRNTVRMVEECLDSFLAQRCGTVVLVSGDAAFVPVLTRLRAAGLRVCVAGRRGAIAPQLAEVADDLVEMGVLDESY